MHFLRSSLLLAGLFVVILLSPASVSGQVMLRDVRYDTKGTHTRVVMEFSGPVRYQSIDSQNTEGYFHIDISGVNLAGIENRNIRLDDQRIVVLLVRTFPNVNTLRLVFHTDGVHDLAISTLSGPERLVVDVYDRGRRPASAVHRPTGSTGGPTQAFEPPPTVAAAQAAPRPQVVRSSRAASSGRSPFVVVIDPGHGGHSRGAVSRVEINGRKILEKDMALAISLELKRLIDADPTLEAVILRDRDIYLSLEDRVSMSEETRGDVFVSIHLNSILAGVPGSQAQGIEVFYADDRASRQLVSRITRQTAGGRSTPSTVASSVERHARSKVHDLVQKSSALARHIEAAYTQIPYFRTRNRGVKRANFYVLKNAYMPAVLLEVCFLSNDADTRFIIQQSNQRAVARTVYEAVKAYRDAQSQ